MLIDSLLALLAALPLPGLDRQFMQRALLGLLLLAPPCAGLGTLVIEFRMAFFAEAIAHSAFTGVALGLLLGVDPRWSMLAFGLLVGFVIDRLQRDLRLATETVTGVLLSTNVALGIALISRYRGLGATLNGFLFGDILTVDRAELSVMIWMLVSVTGFLALGYNRLLLIALDEDLARIEGIRVDAWRRAFAALVALVILVAVRAVGILLATALLVIPAAGARTLAGRAAGFFWLAVAWAVIAVGVGLTVSFRFDLATGATVILAAAATFAGSWLGALVSGRTPPGGIDAPPPAGSGP